MKLYVAVLTCRQFATFKQPTRPAAIVASSHDEALGKAIQEARRAWRGTTYSDHNAEVVEVSAHLVEQVCGQSRESEE